MNDLSQIYALTCTILALSVKALGAASVLCTLLAHASFVPAQLAAVFARVGVATSRFAVEKKQ